MGGEGRNYLNVRGAMSVYVDNGRYSFGRMKMCHMIADTHDELVAMAEAIGVNGRWLQKAGTYQEHFDICAAKRTLAINRGAISVTQKELAKLSLKKWANQEHPNGQ